MANQGAWVAYDPDQQLSPIIESAAESALWQAVEHGMKVVFWPFGKSLTEAIADGVVKVRPAPRKPGARSAAPASIRNSSTERES